MTQRLVERSMKTVHQFAWELRPTLLDDLGLVPALRSYAKTFSKRTGIDVRFAADARFDRAGRRTAPSRCSASPRGRSRTSSATPAPVGRGWSCGRSPGAVRLEVQDDGRSFDVRRMENSKKATHLGLLVMRERVEMVGGAFSIASARGHAERRSGPTSPRRRRARGVSRAANSAKPRAGAAGAPAEDLDPPGRRSRRSSAEGCARSWRPRTTSPSSARPRDGRQAVAMALAPATRRHRDGHRDAPAQRARGHAADPRRGSRRRVLILSAHSDEEYVDRVTTLGAVGYVLKQSSLEDLATAIRTARAGKPYFSPSIVRSAHDGKAAGAANGPRTPKARLTSREAEVLQLIAEGKANKQTAAQLGISIKTVEKHRQSLMTKLDIHDVAGLTRHAIAVGIIEGRDRNGAF